MAPAEPRTPPERASPLLRQRMRAVFKELPKGLAGEEEAVHQMRVAGRRLRVALPLLAKRPEGKRVKRALRVLRDLTRTAGQSRDLDVALDLLEAGVRQAPSGEALPPAGKLALGRLRAARTRSRRGMAEALMDLEIARLRRDLRAVLARRADDLFTVLARIRAERDVRGAALLQGFAELGDRYDPVALHALRRLSRRLRYVSEVHDALMRDAPSEAPGLFKSLQEKIGVLHDAHVLARWLEARATAARAAGREAEAGAFDALRDAFDARARELHVALLAARPSELASRGLAAMGRSRSAA